MLYSSFKYLFLRRLPTLIDAKSYNNGFYSITWKPEQPGTYEMTVYIDGSPIGNYNPFLYLYLYLKSDAVKRPTPDHLETVDRAKNPEFFWSGD